MKDLVSLLAFFVSFCSLLIVIDNRRYVRFVERLAEVRLSIASIHNSSFQCLMRNGDDAKSYFNEAMVGFVQLHALCRDNLSLDSLVGQSVLSKKLSNFHRVCVAEDIINIEINSDNGSQKVREMEQARRELILAIEDVAKRLNRIFVF